MTRFVLDAPAVLALVESGTPVGEGHELLAPTLVRSQTLSLLHEAVHRGDLTEELARERLAALQGLRLRLLGDAVLRKVAWELATELGWTWTYDAEYVALTRLQADALVTLDPDLARDVRHLVRVAPLSEVTAADRGPGGGSG